MQVADRFHLLVNASDAVQRVVDRHREQLSLQVQQVVTTAVTQPKAPSRPGQNLGLPRAVAYPSQIRANRELKRRQRAVRWDQARALIAQGLRRHAVCRQLRIGNSTLRHVLMTDGCPPHAAMWRTLRDFTIVPEAQRSGTDEVTRSWQAGEHNGRELYNQIRAQGYRGSYQLVLRFLQPLRQQRLEALEDGLCPAAVPTVPLTMPTLRTITRRLPPRLVARCLAGNPPANSDEDQRQVAQLCDAVPELAAARELATTFRTLLTEHQLEQMAPWLDHAASSSLVEFQAFAASLLRKRVVHRPSAVT